MRVKKVLNNKNLLIFIISLQEAFIAIIPFFILTGFLTLLNIFIQQYDISFLFIDPLSFNDFTKNIQSFSSVIPVISISYFFAKRLKISQIIAVILSVTVFITIVFYENPSYPLILPYGFTAATITAPIISAYFLKVFYFYFSLKIDIPDGRHHIYRLFNYIFVFFVAYFASMFLYIAIDFVMDSLIEKYNPFELKLPELILLVIRNFLVQTFWFFGMHGEHMVNALFGKELLFKEMFPNLTYGEFQRIFVNIGGAGVGLAILISLFLSAKDKTIRKIAGISSPFTLFNIDDILIFLIIVFNKFLFLAFLFVPILNVIIAYLAIKTFNITFSEYKVVWFTPVFFDAYIKSFSLKTIFLQVGLLVLDVFIYYFFMKRYFQKQSLSDKKTILETNLEIERELKAKTDIKAFQATHELIEANAKINNLLKKINTNNLLLFYQPKVDIADTKADKFEALLRYNENGEIKGPYFLDIIEKAGLAPIIDIWVCKKVKEDLKTLKQNINDVYVNINLHPDTLKSCDAIAKIISLLKNEPVYFEIIERSLVDNNAKKNIEKLKENGFLISIDDYGVGYSSLETLIKYDIDELKLDKTLIDKITTSRGYLICAHTINLCKELDIKVVAEGVESKIQLRILKDLEADMVQGFIFSPALPLEKAIEFSKTRN